MDSLDVVLPEPSGCPVPSWVTLSSRQPPAVGCCLHPGTRKTGLVLLYPIHRTFDGTTTITVSLAHLLPPALHISRHTCYSRDRIAWTPSLNLDVRRFRIPDEALL